MAHNVTWAFWLKLREDALQPTYTTAQDAVRGALPGYRITFAMEEVKGNPRDGYLHPVTLHADGPGVSVVAEFGVFSSFAPQIDDESLYELHSIAPRVTSALPWKEQECVWRQMTRAFGDLGYEDATMTTEVFAETVRAASRQ